MSQNLSHPSSAVAEAQRWANGLAVVAALIGRRFPRAEPRERVVAYLRGLISPLERKNGWQLAEEAGDEKPYGMQHLLGRAVWSADEVRADLAAYVVEHLSDAEAILVVDETGFVKKGAKSVGVQRQYSGTAGRLENCQIGVFLVMASKRGRTFLDRELYLPKHWAADGRRREEAGVPEEVKFATKPELARRMIGRALEAEVTFGWVTGDSVYGSDWRMRAWLEEQGIYYVLGVTSQYRIFTKGERQWASTVVGEWPQRTWRRCSCGEGSKGERLYEWARMPIREVDEKRRRWLLARRSISDPKEVAYYVVSGPKETSLEEMARVAGTRWAVEESFETAKGEVGLDQYEVRSWEGWYRHITLCLLAHAYLTVVRAQAVAEQQEAQKKMGRERARRRALRS